MRIKDVAQVELSQEQLYSTVFRTLSGKKAAQMNVYTLPGANALQVAQEVRELMATDEPEVSRQGSSTSHCSTPRPLSRSRFSGVYMH